MSLSRDEAAEALAAIDAAGGRMRSLGYYADLAPCIMAWGLVWMAAHLVAEFRLAPPNLAWLIGMAIAGPITIWSMIRQSRRTAALVRQAGGDPRAIGNRFVLLGSVGMGFYVAIMIVVAPLSGNQTSALISLLVAFAYAMAGIWVGRRFLVIGVAAGVAVLFGYLMVHQHFHLWMGLTAGSALLLGGFWLRKV